MKRFWDHFQENQQRKFLLLNKIFFSFFQKTLEERINLNYDAISLFICICFCTKYRQLMISRGVLAIETYWENVEKMLWDRFEVVMKSHNESIRQLDVRKMTVDTRPHYVCFYFFFLIFLKFFFEGKKRDFFGVYLLMFIMSLLKINPGFGR